MSLCKRNNLYFFLLVIVTQFICKSIYAQQVVPLMTNNSFKTMIALPFRLQDTDGLPISVSSVSINSSSCMSMIDPNINSNFFIKCKTAQTPTATILFLKANKAYRIYYGPINIVSLGAGAVPPSPATPTTNIALGKSLFNQHCLNCHQSPYDKQNKSSTKIQSSIANIGVMKNLLFLNATEIQAISQYLNNLP